MSEWTLVVVDGCAVCGHPPGTHAQRAVPEWDGSWCGCPGCLCSGYLARTVEGRMADPKLSDAVLRLLEAFAGLEAKVDDPDLRAHQVIELLTSHMMAARDLGMAQARDQLLAEHVAVEEAELVARLRTLSAELEALEGSVALVCRGLREQQDRMRREIVRLRDEAMDARLEAARARDEKMGLERVYSALWVQAGVTGPTPEARVTALLERLRGLQERVYGASVAPVPEVSP